MNSESLALTEKTKKDFRKMAFEIFKPDDAKIYNTLEVPEHYTIVHFIPSSFKNHLIKMANKLHEIDNSIILNPSDKYHITIFHCPISVDPSKLKIILKNFFENHTLTINFTNLIIGALGISIGGFPTEDNLIKLRKSLYKAAEIEFPNDYRATACWILLGRFSEPPKSEVIQFVRDNYERNFGNLTIDSALILKSHHKMLLGAEEI